MLSKFNVAKYNTIIGKSWSFVKLFVMQNYTDNADGDVPLTVKNAILVISSEVKVCTCSFEKKNKTFA